MQHHTQVTILQELMRQLDAGQNIDAGVQYRMPTKDYVCTDRAQQEQKHFFRDHPHVVGLSNDLPENGCFCTVDELGIPILTTRYLKSDHHKAQPDRQHRRDGAHHHQIRGSEIVPEIAQKQQRR